MPHRSWVSVDVNGQQQRCEIDHRTTLLDVLRDHLDLTGAKRACDRGECGACTVLLEGQPVYACHLLAMQVRGRPVVTIEGLAEQPDFRPVLEAFVANDAGQCGFCTPGMVMSCAALLKSNPHPTEKDVRHAIAGNLCRCGTYPRIFTATLEVAGTNHKA